MAYKVSPLSFRSKRQVRLRARLFIEANFTCVICGWRPPERFIPNDYDGNSSVIAWWSAPDLRMIELQVDHRRPRCRGGTHGRRNLQVLCSSCNARKGGR